MRITFVIVFFICFFALITQGQIPSFKENSKDSIYTFFAQIDQKISLKLNGADPSKIEIKLVDGFANKVNDSIYNIRYNMNYDEAKIKLYYKNFPVDIMIVKSQNMAISGIRLGDFVDKNVKLSQLSSIKNFELLYPKEMPLQLKPELFSCKITIYQPGILEPFFTNIRNLDIPANIQKIIIGLPKDSKISFEEIRIKTITNNVLNLENEAIVFTIVE